jgi:hypothetical protein
MQLGSEGSDDASITAHTAQVFSRVVSSTAGPLLVVIWTKYADVVEMFQERLYENYPEYKGKLLFARLEKPANADEIEVNKLGEEISLALKNYYPAEILWRWEQLAHDAASATTEGISRHATNRAGFDPEESQEASTTKLLKGLSDVLRILISAEAEQTISPETAFRDLLGVLNPLHYDRLEHEIEPDDSKAGESLVQGQHVYPTQSEKLELNSMLLAAQYNTGGSLFRPGVIFAIDDSSGFELRFRIVIAEAFTEILDGPKNPELNKFLKKLERTDLDENRRAVFLGRVTEEEEKVRQTRDEWFAKCVPILVDISASCDFAQDNPRLARLMMGLMVPEGSGIEYHRTGAFRELPTIKIPGYGDGGWDLVFCSRFVFSVSPKVAAGEIRPICRLRESILADLRGWASAQDARGGYVSVK